MIRILHIVGSLERAGAETFLMNLYRNIDRNRIQFDFAIYREPTPNSYYEEALSLGAKVYKISPKAEGVVKNLKEVKNIVKENRYEIVWRHVDNCFAGIDLLAAKCAGAKRLILHAHNSNVNGKIRILHFLSKPCVNMFITDRFACGKAAGRWLFGNRKFKILNNGIDTERFRFNETIRREYREKYGISDELVIGHVGRFCEVKNHIFIINLFHELSKNNSWGKKALLVLAGTGEKESEIKDQVSQYGLDDKVLFLGNRSDVAELMQMMDVFIMPSFYEGFPVTLLEAQTSGLPCVVSDAISREVDITGNVEFLCLDAGMEVWENAVRKLSENKREEKAGMIEKAGYDIRNVAKWVEDFGDLLARRNQI